jgi:hypothetical protein
LGGYGRSVSEVEEEGEWGGRMGDELARARTAVERARVVRKVVKRILIDLDWFLVGRGWIEK